MIENKLYMVDDENLTLQKNKLIHGHEKAEIKKFVL